MQEKCRLPLMQNVRRQPRNGLFVSEGLIPEERLQALLLKEYEDIAQTLAMSFLCCIRISSQGGTEGRPFRMERRDDPRICSALAVFVSRSVGYNTPCVAKAHNIKNYSRSLWEIIFGTKGVVPSAPRKGMIYKRVETPPGKV